MKKSLAFSRVFLRRLKRKIKRYVEDYYIYKLELTPIKAINNYILQFIYEKDKKYINNYYFESIINFIIQEIDEILVTKKIRDKREFRIFQPHIKYMTYDNYIKEGQFKYKKEDVVEIEKILKYFVKVYDKTHDKNFIKFLDIVLENNINLLIFGRCLTLENIINSYYDRQDIIEIVSEEQKETHKNIELIEKEYERIKQNLLITSN